VDSLVWANKLRKWISIPIYNDQKAKGVYYFQPLSKRDTGNSTILRRDCPGVALFLSPNSPYPDLAWTTVTT
jgi:hypothetical protein